MYKRGVSTNPNHSMQCAVLQVLEHSVKLFCVAELRPYIEGHTLDMKRTRDTAYFGVMQRATVE